jgi:Uma2 family endonuclease
MNVVVSQGQDVLPRRAFSVEDVRRMIEAGVLGEDERFELIEGELVVMSAKGIAHERVKHALNKALVRAAPDGVFVGIESTQQLAKNILVEPDIIVISEAVYKAPPKSYAQPRPEDVLLLIEIAVSSIAYDRRVKARLYARHGIREFWVIDANARTTWVHTGPQGDGWASIIEHGGGDELTTLAVPGFSFRLADLD